MNYKTILQFVQSIITSIENTGIALGNSIRENLEGLSEKTLSVRVENPQKKVEVTGEVKVDQSKTEAQLKNTALAIRELKNALKPLKEIRVSNFPSFPKFPDFPKVIKVSNMPTETKVSNMKEFVQAVQKISNAIEKIEFEPEIKVSAPNVVVNPTPVNVPKQPAPIVNVEAPDMSGLSKIMDFLDSVGVKKPLAVRLSDGAKFYKALEKMADIYAGSSFSAFQNSDGSEGRGMLNRNSELKATINDTWDANDVDKFSSTVTYFGEETIDGSWRVRKVVKDGTLTSIRHATERNNIDYTSYEPAWDARATLDYGYAREL